MYAKITRRAHDLGLFSALIVIATEPRILDANSRKRFLLNSQAHASNAGAELQIVQPLRVLLSHQGCVTTVSVAD
jgi:hypothetical protein